MRQALAFSTTLLVGLSVVTPAAGPVGGSSVAAAYDKTFPDQLDSADGIADGRQQKINLLLERQQQRRQQQPYNPPSFGLPGPSGSDLGSSNNRSPGSIGQFSATPAGSIVWAGALWLLSGSRSTPLATPLANLLYSEADEAWLKDRNDGLFANLPLPLLLLLASGFVLLGVLADGTVTALSGSDGDSSLQLAGVTLIGGATLELGRVASGEKRLTRVESDREAQLEAEFQAFADSRLKLGGTCHRLDVVRAFRRYYAKYRQPDNPDYPLSDLEIEQLLRGWTRRQDAGVEMSSSGFYTGIKVNQDADVFTAAS
jgi:hypothetical protein